MEGNLRMSRRRELQAILDGLRKNLVFSQEWGLDPPTLSPSTLEFLDGRDPATCVRPSITQGERTTEAPATLEGLRDLIGDCRRCRLWSGRTRIVFGEGSPSARLVFVGDAPGKDEDVSGRPFAGGAGKLLTRIIQDGMRVRREEVYICNVVKCRPPDDRTPSRDEIESCLPFLREQLRIIKPAVVCSLGGLATGALTGKEGEILKERGTWVSHASIPLMPTLHPAYILSRPDEERRLKGFVWEDVQKIMNRLGIKIGK
jgi:uracil-DNA glycosylase